jgi:hypothetical protein
MPRRVFIVAVAIAVLAWVAWSLTRAPVNVSPQGSRADSIGSGLRAVRVYFAAPAGDSLVTEARELAETHGTHDRVVALVSELDRGPHGSGVRSLPPGIAALHVYLDDGGLLTVDLSREFRDGFKGGSTAEYLAVASLVRTLGANLPEVKRVMLVCGGEPLPTLGGHLPLDRPIEVRDLP